MINYNELQKQVFTWLKEKNERDQNFTFSLRRKATKGAEQNYFIGTEKSKYFSTTFWNIPVAYPGSAGELVSLVFDLRNKNKLEYSIQFNQTKDPHDKQNKYALELIKKIKPIFLEKFPHANAAKESNKMEYFSLSSGAKYDAFSELIPDLESTLTAVIPLVDQQIDLFKKKNTDFIASRISEEEQTKMIEKMGERLKKHGFLPTNNNGKIDYFNTDGISALTEKDDGNVRSDTFEKLEYLKEQLEKEIGIKFTSANHLEEGAKNSNIIVEIRFQPLHVEDESFEIIIGFGNEDDDAEYNLKTFFRLFVDSQNAKLAYSINEEYGVAMTYENFPDNWKNLLEILKPKLEAIIKKVEIVNILQPIITNDKMNIPVNQILYGPPGTGKTFNTINKAISIANPEFDLNQERRLVKVEYDRLVLEKQIVFTTFHQSMSYEDFIEGIKPETQNGTVYYDVIPGIFLKLCTAAENNLEDVKQGDKHRLSFDEAFSKLKEEWVENEEMKFPLKRKGYDFTILGFTTKSIQFKKASGGTGHTLSIATLKDYYYNKREIKSTGVGIYYPAVLNKLNSFQVKKETEKFIKNYVIIIDEINRGNISQIFGELITLIEKDKRLGKEESLEVLLPYSHDKFGVPPNVFIIGTMNTADRSVEALDTALRRRFSFEEILPNSSLIATEGKAKESLGIIETIDLPKVLDKINDRIEILSNRDHKIGHAYFLNVTTLEELRETFKKNIIPLLQEYFYNDYEKIGWVLGEGFFEEKKIDKKVIFSKFFKAQKPEFDVAYQLSDIDTIDIKEAMLRLLGTLEEVNQSKESAD